MISIRFLCEAAPMSMLWARNRLNKLPEECFKFSLILIHLANGQWHFKQANHGMFSNLDTQVGALNKDFGDVSQTDLTRNLVPSVAQATQWAIGKIPKTINLKLNICISSFVLCMHYHWPQLKMPLSICLSVWKEIGNTFLVNCWVCQGPRHN